MALMSTVEQLEQWLSCETAIRNYVNTETQEYLLLKAVTRQWQEKTKDLMHAVARNRYCELMTVFIITL
jgi:hypothetical protein